MTVPENDEVFLDDEDEPDGVTAGDFPGGNFGFVVEMLKLYFSTVLDIEPEDLKVRHKMVCSVYDVYVKILEISTFLYPLALVWFFIVSPILLFAFLYDFFWEYRKSF